MFSSNCPSSRFMTQEIGLSNAYSRSLKRDTNQYQNLITTTATHMISDVEKLKEVLNHAIESYLDKIKDKFFRSAGRKRAINLQFIISNATNTSQLIPHLSETIKEGNEEDDSLKTFLMKAINMNYGDKKIFSSSPKYISYESILQDIIYEINKQLKPICMQTFSDTSEMALDLNSEPNKGKKI